MQRASGLASRIPAMRSTLVLALAMLAAGGCGAATRLAPPPSHPARTATGGARRRPRRGAPRTTALRTIVPALRGRGFRFVTLRTLLGAS
jgi:hypothetical protein